MSKEKDITANKKLSEKNTPVCRGIRGAITVEKNNEDEILTATRELLYIMIRANEIDQGDVASAFFTTTLDLNATFPALAARQLGWYEVPLLCGHEMAVPGGLEKCVRILIHWNTTRSSDEIVHVYLKGAKDLRPDKDELPKIPEEEIQKAIDINNLEFNLALINDRSVEAD